MTTAASHQYLPGCPTTLPSVEEQLHGPYPMSGPQGDGGQVSSSIASVPSFIHLAPVFIVPERLGATL